MLHARSMRANEWTSGPTDASSKAASVETREHVRTPLEKKNGQGMVKFHSHPFRPPAYRGTATAAVRARRARPGVRRKILTLGEGFTTHG